MTLSELSDRLGRPALWISRMRKRFGMQILEDSRYRRVAMLLLASSRSLQLRSHALLSIRSFETWGKECHSPPHCKDAQMPPHKLPSQSSPPTCRDLVSDQAGCVAPVVKSSLAGLVEYWISSSSVYGVWRASCPFTRNPIK